MAQVLNFKRQESQATRGVRPCAKPGVSKKVDPITTQEGIEKVRALLRYNPRDLCLFDLGINTNLRASDLLGLKVGQVRGLEPDDCIEIRERKTGKVRTVQFNRVCIEAVSNLMREAGADAPPDKPLFMGQRGPLTVSTLSRMVKAWCTQVGLKGNYAAHTLRKTWGYVMRTRYGVAWEHLSEAFNHSSLKVTQRYLGIQPEEMKKIFSHEV